MVAGVAVSDKSKWGLCRRPHRERAIARRVPGTRTENLAADYFAAKRLRELTEVDELIVASASQLTYDLSVHLKLIVMPGAAAPLGLSVRISSAMVTTRSAPISTEAALGP